MNDSGWINIASERPGYEQNASAVASVQLEKAGVRLAFVLNRVLGA